MEGDWLWSAHERYEAVETFEVGDECVAAAFASKDVLAVTSVDILAPTSDILLLRLPESLSCASSCSRTDLNAPLAIACGACSAGQVTDMAIAGFVLACGFDSGDVQLYRCSADELEASDDVVLPHVATVTLQSSVTPQADSVESTTNPVQASSSVPVSASERLACTAISDRVLPRAAKRRPPERGAPTPVRVSALRGGRTVLSVRGSTCFEIDCESAKITHRWEIGSSLMDLACRDESYGFALSRTTVYGIDTRSSAVPTRILTTDRSNAKNAVTFGGIACRNDQAVAVSACGCSCGPLDSRREYWYQQEFANGITCKCCKYGRSGSRSGVSLHPDPAVHVAAAGAHDGVVRLYDEYRGGRVLFAHHGHRLAAIDAGDTAVDAGEAVDRVRPEQQSTSSRSGKALSAADAFSAFRSHGSADVSSDESDDEHKSDLPQRRAATSDGGESAARSRTGADSCSRADGGQALSENGTISPFHITRTVTCVAWGNQGTLASTDSAGELHMWRPRWEARE